MKEGEAKEGQPLPEARNLTGTYSTANKSLDNETPQPRFPMMKEGDSKGDLSLPED